MSRLSDIIQNIRENTNYRKRMLNYRVFINPEIKDLYAHKLPVIRRKAESFVQEQKRLIEEIENSYEYKVQKFLCKVKFDNKDKISRLFYCNFDFLEKGENFKFRYKKSLIDRILFKNPYDLPKYYKYTKLYYLGLISLCIIAARVGFKHGFQDSVKYDGIKYNIEDVKHEDQLFNILVSTNKPVAVLYYIPGDHLPINMQFYLSEVAEKYGSDYFTAAKVNCKHNLDLCMKKSQYMKFPQIEIMYPHDERSKDKRFQISTCKTDRTFEGIEGCLMKENVIPDIFNPMLIMQSGLSKSLELHH